MTKSKWKKKKTAKVILIILFVAAAGFGGFSVYGENGMSLEEFVIENVDCFK